MPSEKSVSWWTKTNYLNVLVTNIFSEVKDSQTGQTMMKGPKLSTIANSVKFIIIYYIRTTTVASNFILKRKS